MRRDNILYTLAGLALLPCASSLVLAQSQWDLHGSLPHSSIDAGIILKIDLQEAFAKTHEEFLPIALKCPANNNGVLEQLKKNADGFVIRLRFYLRGSILVYYTNEGSERGEPLQILHETDIINPKGEEGKLLAGLAESAFNKVYNKVCLGTPELRLRYYDYMNTNRIKFDALEN